MHVREILLRRTFLVNKLEEIDSVLSSIHLTEIGNKGELYTKLINAKFDLLSKIRSHTILLDSLNNSTLVEVEGTTLSVYEALHLLKTLDKKIDTFSYLIKEGALNSLNIFDLILKKDKLLEEYINIYLAVLSSDIKTNWEG